MSDRDRDRDCEDGQEEASFQLSISSSVPTDTASSDAQTSDDVDDGDDECEHGQTGCPGPGPHDDALECWECYQTREDVRPDGGFESAPDVKPKPKSSGYVDKEEYAADEFVVPLTADVLETRLQKEGFVVVNRFYQSKREIEYMYVRADSEDEWDRLYTALRVAVGTLGFSPDIGADEDQYHAVVRIWRRPSDPSARIFSSPSRTVGERDG